MARKTLVATFGRFNPPTRGHEILLRHVEHSFPSLNRMVFVSPTQDHKSNPLSWTERVSIIHKLFPDLPIGPKDVTSPLGVIRYAEQRGYDTLQFIVGADRLLDFQRLVDESHGNRSCIRCAAIPGIPSASDARVAAQAGDLDAFASAVMSRLPTPTVERLMHHVADALGLRKETRMFTFKEWRSHAHLTEVTPEDPEKDPKGNPSEEVEQTPTEPEPIKPLPPLPVDAEEDDGRVKDDNPEDQAVLVLHPPHHMRIDMSRRSGYLSRTK